MRETTMAKNTTTLYISDTGIRLMVTRGKRITKLAYMPLDVNLTDLKNEEKEAELVNKIKLLFKSNRIGARKIILGISGLHCLTRPVSLPELPKAMVDEAITREAKRVLPVPLDQLYISWQIASSFEGKIQVFVVAIPKYIADALVKILNKTGFKPYLMDIKPLALSRVSHEASAIIVDIQPKEFDIIIVSKGIPQTIRTVPFPMEYLVHTDRLSIVRDELKRTIQFYNSNNPDNLLQTNSAMLVSGELVDEAETVEFLTQELGYKTSLLLSPLKCVKQLDPSHYLVNVGLALKELPNEAATSLPNFNTLPLPYQPKQISRGRLIAVPAAAATVGLIVMLVFMIQNAAAKIDQDQIMLDSTKLLLEQKQAQKTELRESIATMEQEVSDIETSRDTYIAALASLNNKGELINGDLNATVDNVVTNLELYSISHNESQLVLTGQALTEEEVMQYVRNLQNTNRFSEITISSLTRVAATDNGTDYMIYSLVLKLERGQE
jgi:type IV pilus assembly protein PilM